MRSRADALSKLYDSWLHPEYMVVYVLFYLSIFQSLFMFFHKWIISAGLCHEVLTIFPRVKVSTFIAGVVPRHKVE